MLPSAHAAPAAPAVSIEMVARREAVAAATGWTMHDDGLLARACTHLSLLGAQAGTRRNADSNERLEFLGDALLGGAICDLLYCQYPDDDEGKLTRLKSRLVSRTVLARVIESAGLLPHCRIGSQMGGDPSAWPDSLKANLMEAVLAAIHLDGGWLALRSAVERLWTGLLTDPESAEKDIRQRVQEECHRRFGRRPDYLTERSGGSDHQPEFTATAAIAGFTATGTGQGRRKAEAAAATALLKQLEAVVEEKP